MKYDAEKLQQAYFRKKELEGFSFERLGKACGISTSCAAGIISNGKGRPENVERIARALGLKGRQAVLIKVKTGRSKTIARV